MLQITETAKLSGLPLLGSLLEFRRDRAGLMLRANREGDAVAMKLGFLDVFIINTPKLAHEVLVEKHDSFIKDIGLRVFGREVLGNGLLTNEHVPHRRQRRMMSPMFTPARVASFAPVMVDCAARLQLKWQHGDRIDVAAEMNQVTLQIVGKTLFGSDVSAESREITDALRTAMQHVVRSVNSLIPLSPNWPTPGNLRNRRAVSRLNATVYRMIAERRRAHEQPNDFLSMLLAAQDQEDGRGMSDEQVRDEAMTIFLAGHETTSNVLGWAWYLLMRYPDAYAKLQREVDEVLGGRLPTLEDVERLPYTSQVLKETLRLYPPVYILGREADSGYGTERHRPQKGRDVASGYGTERHRPQKGRDVAVMSTCDIAPTLAATRDGV